jgi:CRISPR system Cascade subunit CasB
MSMITTTADPAAPSPSDPASDRATTSRPGRTPVGDRVSARVQQLQATRGTSATTATLARLRANVAARPGIDPAIWSVTVDGVSPDARGDEPTHAEVATHLALTLYAVHQQSRDAGAHRPGTGLGQAVARLDRARGWSTKDQDEGKVSPVRRRFNAVVTATSTAEVAHHLRGLVSLMRSEDVGLDYGMLADDLAQLQKPGGKDVVRRRWGRQLHRLDPVGAPADSSTDAPTTHDTTPNHHAQEDQ